MVKLFMNKVILYYKFIPVTDPVMTMRWQRELCTRLGLKGRIIISPHGINGTLGGEMESVLEYKREMNRSVLFKNITYKWSDGTGDDFPRLSVKVRDELVAFGAPDEIKVNEHGVIGTGTHLKPEQVHQLVAEKGDERVMKSYSLTGAMPTKHRSASSKALSSLIPAQQPTLSVSSTATNMTTSKTVQS